MRFRWLCRSGDRRSRGASSGVLESSSRSFSRMDVHPSPRVGSREKTGMTWVGVDPTKAGRRGTTDEHQCTRMKKETVPHRGFGIWFPVFFAHGRPSFATRLFARKNRDDVGWGGCHQGREKRTRTERLRTTNRAVINTSDPHRGCAERIPPFMSRNLKGGLRSG